MRGYDTTFSAPKSVSVLFALGDTRLVDQVVAHERAVDAVLGWVQAQAHTRMRHRGQVVCVDAEGSWWVFVSTPAADSTRSCIPMR